jgi:hypothetical protein
MTVRKKIFYSLCLAFFSILFLFNIAKAEDPYGFNETARKTPLFTMSISRMPPESIAQYIVQLVLFFISIIFFALVLYSGFMWMIARGDSAKVTAAKQILETAVIGLIVVAASYAIATFIFNRLTTEPNPATPTTETE